MMAKREGYVDVEGVVANLFEDPSPSWCEMLATVHAGDTSSSHVRSSHRLNQALGDRYPIGRVLWVRAGRVTS